MKKITELLPKDLSPEAVKEITTFIQEVIDTEIANEMAVLEAKVAAFLRQNIELLKEQAIKELELTDPTYRNAKVFETIKDVMCLELGTDDEESSLSNVIKETKQMESEIEVITKELHKVIGENEKLSKLNKILTDKNKLTESKLNETKTVHENLTHKIKQLNEDKNIRETKKPFNSTEKALVIGGGNGKGHETSPQYDNPMLNEDVMKLMPKD